MLDDRFDCTPPICTPPTPSGGFVAGSAIDDRFVGRLDELALLRSAIDTTWTGTGGLFLISGEPGIGKTRLAIEASSAARAQGVHVVWGRCWEAGGSPPYWPWIEVLRQVLGSAERPSVEALGRHAAQLARLVPEAFPDTAPVAAPTDPESGRFLLFDAVATVLRLAAARCPLLVVVDDFHAADRASVLLLAFLARSLERCRAVLVGTYRDAEAYSTPDLVAPLGELSRSASRVALRGLGVSDVRSMIEGQDGARASDVLVERIHRVTDGNPFFVRELARLLPTDVGSDSSAAAFGIPQGIRETVRRRLHALPERTRALLATAAVAGRAFDGVIVSRAAHIEMISFLDLLEPAIALGVVDAVAGESGRFAFRHALIQETIYSELTPAVRIRTHKAVRDALEDVSATAPDRYVAELGHHALAAAPSGDDERFVEHAVRAARSAMQRMAFEEAVRLYQLTIDALVHARPDERRRCELLLALGEAKEWSSDARGSRVVIEQAADVARALAAPDLLARAALAVGGIEALKATASWRCETALDLLHEALAGVAAEDRSLRAQLRGRLALSYLTTGPLADALVESAAALADARACSDAEVLPGALISRHAVLYGPDHLEERCAIADELGRIAEARRSREFAMRAHALHVVNAFELGDMATADDALALHGRLAAETQDPFDRWVNLMWRAVRALLTGSFDQARALSQAAFDLTQNVPGPHAFEFNGPSAYVGQQVLIEDVRFGPPLDVSVLDAARARYHEVPMWQVAKLHSLTRIGLVQETRTELDLLFARGILDAERSGLWLATTSALAEAVAFVDDRERAGVLYSLLLPYADHNITVSLASCRGSVSRFLGLLATTLDDRTAAERHFAEALAMNRRMGARPHVAATLYDHATALVRGAPTPHDAGRAAQMCREALHIASDLGMPGLKLRCDELLAMHERPESSDTGAYKDDFELVVRGAFWSLAHADRQAIVKHRKGLYYIAELLRQPGRDIHTRDLAAMLAPAPGARGYQSVQRGSDFSEDLVDPKARRAYSRRLATLDDELYASASGDPEQLAVLHEERIALQSELARVTRLGGRPRRSGDRERVRIAVTRAIRSALAEIASADADLGGTLARRIRTGTYCRYSPAATSR